MMRLLFVGTVVLFLSAFVLSSGCMRSPFAGPDPSDQENAVAAVPVEAAPIQRGVIEAIVRSSRALEAEEEVKVFSRTSNRVAKLLVEEGDVVEKGQLLVQLEDDIQKTQFNKAKVRFEKAQEEFARQKPLFDQNLISEQAFKDVEFEMKQLALAFEDAQRDLDYTEIRAPISGTVTARRVNYGDLVNLNQHLFDLIDFESIVARLYVPEQELSSLTIGQPARVTSDALKETVFQGYIKRIAPIVESKTGTVKITVGFKDVGTLRPGMYVDVEIVTSRRSDAILISKRSLVYDSDRMFVFRVRPDQTVERLPVIPKTIDELNIEPVSGFQEGDLIVVAGQSGLKDGALVRLPEAAGSSTETKPATARSTTAL